MDNSPLAKLPPELRNNIYELALHSLEPIVTYYDKHSTGFCNPYINRVHVLALPATCKQLRAETLNLLYSLLSVEVNYCPYLLRLPDVVRRFLQAVPLAYASQLKALVFEPGDVRDDERQGEVGALLELCEQSPALRLQLRLTRAATKVQSMFVHGRDILLDSKDIEASCMEAAAFVKSMEGRRVHSMSLEKLGLMFQRCLDEAKRHRSSGRGGKERWWEQVGEQ